MMADDSSDESFNDDVRPMNALRDGQLDQGPVGVDNDDRLSLESGEVVSDDEDFNTRHQLRRAAGENFQFRDYPRMVFRFLDVTVPGINLGLSSLLKSSPKMLYAPNDTTNLCFRFSQVPDNVFTRESLRDNLTPLLTLETVCDLSENFLTYPPMTRNVEWDRNLVKVVPENDFYKFEMSFQTGENAYQEYQKKYSCGLWLMHLSASSGSTPLQFKLSDEAVVTNCVLVFVKTFSFVKNFTPRGSRPPIWPDVQGRKLNQKEKMIKIRSRCCVVPTAVNQPIIDRLRKEEIVSITYVGELAQFLKALRMISFAERPQEVPVHLDYNVSQVYDGIINPNAFNFHIYGRAQSLKDKFARLMRSKDLGLLLVEGAPGTGKTSTAAEAIADYILAAKESSQELPRILVTAPSNAAADVFFLHLYRRLPNITICRHGEKERFLPEARRLSNEVEEKHRQRCYDNRARIEHTIQEKMTQRVIKRMFIREATIVVVTLGSSQSSDLIFLRHRLQFDLLVVDECGQAKLDEILFPLHFTSIRRLLLIGDPRQLGPTLKSSIVLHFPAEQTSTFVKFFAFLQQNVPQAIVQLREQHRMRPLVASMVSCISYNHTDHLTTKLDGKWQNTLLHPALLVFSGESWIEKRAGSTFSYENRKEAEFGMELLRASLECQGFNFMTRCFPNGKQLTYVIIPLYRGQVNLYRRLLLETKLDKTVKVSTVDQMQGSECDIAIVSAVRASLDHLSVGFASDLRRLNVALSRGACVYVLAKHIDFYTRQGWSTLFHEASRINCVYTNADQILQDKKLADIINTRAQDTVTEVVPVRPRD